MKKIFNTILIILAMQYIISLFSIAEEDQFFGKYYTFKSQLNGKVMDATYYSLQQNESRLSDSQKFLLIAASDVTKPGSLAASYYIISKPTSLAICIHKNAAYGWLPEKNEKSLKTKISLLMEDEEPNPVKDFYGNVILLSKYIGVTGQKWKLQKLSGSDNGYYAIYAYGINNKAIGSYEVPGDEKGNILRIFNWENNSSQKWEISAAENAPISDLAEPVIDQGWIYEDLPSLNSFNQNMPTSTTPRLVSDEYIPYIYIKCDGAGPNKASTNPWYVLRFEQFWKKIETFEFDGIRTQKDEYKISISEETLNAFDEKIDETLSAGIKAGYRNIVNLGIDGSWNKQNITKNGTTEGSIFEKTQKIEYYPGIRKYACIYQMIDRYSILNIDGNQVCEPIEIPTGITHEVYYAEKVKFQ